jgi:hypothetical protein
LVFLVQPNVQYQTYNHGTERTELNGVEIVPTQEMAENQQHRSENDEDDAQILQKCLHIFIYFLVYLSKRSAKKHNYLQLEK